MIKSTMRLTKSLPVWQTVQSKIISKVSAKVHKNYLSHGKMAAQVKKKSSQVL